MHSMHMATSRTENSAQILSCYPKFVHHPCQGALTEGKGSVQLTSSLGLLVLYKDK
jgi:hypothetical protein